MRTSTFREVDVESFPRPLAEGILYRSARFNTAAHACACGCGKEVITPLSPVQWKLIRGNKGPSLRPSIGNWNFPCRSHYWITNGRVEWAANMKKEDIVAGRKFNAKLRDDYFRSNNEEAPEGAPPINLPDTHSVPPVGAWQRFLRWLLS